MRVRPVALPLLLLVALLAPTGQAALNPEHAFQETTPFSDAFESTPAFVSAAVDLEADGARNGSLWIDVEEFGVRGIQRLCWQDDGNHLQCHEGTALSITVAAGSSASLQHPKTYDVAFEAGHALGLFMDLGAMFGEDRPEELELGPAFIAVPVDGTVTIPRLDPVPVTPFNQGTTYNSLRESMALLFSFSDASRFTLRDGTTVIDTLGGSGRWVGFQGAPLFDPVHADLVGVPFPDGAMATFSPASAAAAAEGLDPDHFTSALNGLQGTGEEDAATDLGGAQDILDTLADVLNGALIGFDAGGNSTEGVEALTLVRFHELTAARSGDDLDWDGQAVLLIADGEVAGASHLVGVFPWWSFLLWAIAIGLFVTRIVLKSDKHHPVWDKLNWVGFAGGAVAGILVFWLWDLEVKAVWVTSLLSGGSSGAGLAFIALVQLVPLLIASIGIGLPARIAMQSAFRIGKQGRFMRLGAVIAPFLTYLLGVTLLIDFLGLVLEQLQDGALAAAVGGG